MLMEALIATTEPRKDGTVFTRESLEKMAELLSAGSAVVTTRIQERGDHLDLFATVNSDLIAKPDSYRR